MGDVVAGGFAHPPGRQLANSPTHKHLFSRIIFSAATPRKVRDAIHRIRGIHGLGTTYYRRVRVPDRRFVVWPVLALLLWAAAVQATGGFKLTILRFPFTSRDPLRPLALAAVL